MLSRNMVALKEMSLPSIKTVRERIQKVKQQDVRVCLMCGYLFCARVSELVSKISPSDKSYTTARGPHGSDVKLDVFELGAIKEQAAIFTVSTAKRGGVERLVALPFNSNYEPWTKKVYEYFAECGENPCFPFTRQKVWQYSKQAFDGLRYPIERYTIIKPEGEKNVRKVVNRHFKPFRTHALRHVRASELIEYYGFDGVDLSIYGGWTLRSTIGVGSAMQRYAHLQWRKYFPKLLKKGRF